MTDIAECNSANLSYSFPQTVSDFAFDVVVVGAGIGGISAAVASSRCGAKTILVDANKQLGGTGVYSPLGIVCGLGPTSDFWVNEGILKDFFPHLWNGERFPKTLSYYNERELARQYELVTSAEPNLVVWRESILTDDVHLVAEKTIGSIVVTSCGESCRVKGNVFVDGTADGNLAALAGAEFQVGRSRDGKLQPCTLTFVVRNVDVNALGLAGAGGAPFAVRDNDDKKILSDALGLDEAWQRLKREGRTSNPKNQDWVLFFPSRDGRTLVFNHSRVVDINPLVPGDVERGREAGAQQVREFWDEIKSHPALRGATMEVSAQLGVREGRRIIGDYVLTQEDCLGEARFEDMVAACCYSIDIHDPEGGGTVLREIPGSGYYHIPYRCLRARGWSNLLLGSRCLSGTHEAHSSYRVMSPLSAVGQACGVASALMVLTGRSTAADVPAAQIRQVLHEQGQFTEGDREFVPGLHSAPCG